jgi:RAD51-like protein 2
MSSRLLSTFPLPKTTLSALTRAGYETLHDISSITPEELAKDIGIPLSASLVVFSVSENARAISRTHSDIPLTQSAALMMAGTKKFSSFCVPVDKLLSGGISRGTILEISGPPGTPKESLAINFVRSFLEEDECVLFVDCQNMTSPAAICRILNKATSVPTNYQELIRYSGIHSLSEIMLFMHNLPRYLENPPKTSLLVLNYLTFPFQSSVNVSFQARKTLLDQVKQALTKACATTNICVVITSQLATKFVNSDGSAGNFDTGSRVILVPALGA